MSSNPDPTGDRRTVLPDRREAGTPPNPTPPKSISVDDMLSQLRAPDGQKRRRRSEQPVYTSRRRRRIVIGLVLGVATLALGSYYGFRFFQRLRLEGETFREGVNRRISEAIDCQVELTRIHDGGDSSLSAVEGRFDTRAGDLLASGTFTGINASLTSSSWVSSEWGIKQLSITRGTLQFDPGRTPAATDNMKIVPRSAGREKAGSDVRFSIDPEPDIITLDMMRFTGGLDLEWPAGPDERKPEAIRGMKGHAKFQDLNGTSGALAGGTIALKQWPEMRVELINWNLTGRHLEIPGAVILLGSADARAEISGKADLVRDGTLDLKVNIQSTLLKFLLPSAWHERVGGLFAVKDATFSASFGKGPERKFEGDFTVEGAILRGLPFLVKLGDVLERQALSQVEFPQLTGHFAWSPSSGLEITSLAGEVEGILRLAGSVKVSGAGLVSGRLKASTTETALRARIRPVPHPFGPVADGWASIEFNVSGTATLVHDDIVLPKSPDAIPSIPTPEQRARGPSSAPGPSGEEREELEKQFNELLPQ